MGTSFHPELTADPRVHMYFARLIAAANPLVAKAS
jgi:glutamine amidotransferase PdxT